MFRRPVHSFAQRYTLSENLCYPYLLAHVDLSRFVYPLLLLLVKYIKE